MDNRQEFLVVDIGNSTTKLGYFQSEKLINVWQVPTKSFSQDYHLEPALPVHSSLLVGWLNVAGEVEISDLSIWNKFDVIPRFVKIDTQSEFPFRNIYATPDTLGTDRIVGITGARKLFPKVPVLVIDIGTAITYDYLNREDTYVGGGISPGMTMRFNALHSFTARLPLVEPKENVSLIGNTTIESIRSGVINGIKAEIEGTIEAYRCEAGPDLKVVLTGGDMPFFEKHIKYPNFAEQYLVLIGIQTLLSNYK